MKAVLSKIYGNRNAVRDGEVIGTCVVCNKKIIEDNKAARTIDRLWVCSPGCADKFLKAKKQWAPQNWDEICKMQLLYEERKEKEESLHTV